MALVVTLLFTVVILLVLVSTVGFSTMGARAGGANERTAYRGLLAADSGIGTFPARAGSLPSAEQPRWDVTSDSANPQKKMQLQQSISSWLTSSGLASYSTGDGTVTLSVNDVTLATPGTATASAVSAQVNLVASSSLTGGVGSKSIAQNFTLRLQGGPTIKAPAAVTSYAPLSVSGNAVIQGQSASAMNGLFTAAAVNGAGVSAQTLIAGSNVTFPVTETQYLKVGDYTQIGGQTFKVGTLNAGNSTITASYVGTANVAYSAPSGTSVSKVVNPATQSAALTHPMTIKVADARDYLADDASTSAALGNCTDPACNEGLISTTVTVGGVSYPLTGTVTSKDSSTNTLQVSWSGTLPSGGVLAEGTPLRQNALGAITAGSVTQNGNKGDTPIVGGYVNNSPWLASQDPYSASDWTSTTNLFYSTFNQTKQTLLGSLSAPTAIQDNYAYSGFNYVSAAGQNTQITLCGSGVLLVKGNLKVNGTCAGGFSGLLYVIGDYDQQGNSAIRGSVVVEGVPKVAEYTGQTTCTGEGCTTDVAGTQQSSTGKIVYDLDALMRASATLGTWAFNSVAGTWRQQ